MLGVGVVLFADPVFNGKCLLLALRRAGLSTSWATPMKIHEPISFHEPAFCETPLSEDPDPAVKHAVVPLHERRAFFFTGAGSSAGGPTDLPTGPQLAARLVEWARESGAGEAVRSLGDPTDLGQVCAALEEALAREDVVRHIRHIVDWRHSEFNLCHLTIALLYAEEMLRMSFTANWDPKLEDALDRIACKSRPQIARDKATMAEVGSGAYLVHLHGYYADPESLVMTNEDLDDPEALSWTNPLLRAALVSQDPIFVGFAAEPEYVIRTLSEMRAEMQRPAASVIALEALADFCTQSAALAEALRLGEDAERYVQGDARQVLGELLRCCYRKLLGELLADAEARARAGSGTGRTFTEQGAQIVREALGGLTVEGLLSLLWATTAKTTPGGGAPQATVLSLAAGLAEMLAVLMVLASCQDTAALSVSHGGFRLTREDGSRVDIWAAIPEDHLSPSDALTRVHRHGDRFAGPADSEVPLVLVCAGTSGALPKSEKVKLTGNDDSANVRVGQRVPAGVINFSAIDSAFDGAKRDATLSRGLGL